MEGHTEVARLLIKAGADLTLKANDGLTSLANATSKGHVAIAQLIKDAGGR